MREMNSRLILVLLGLVLVGVYGYSSLLQVEATSADAPCRKPVLAALTVCTRHVSYGISERQRVTSPYSAGRESPLPGEIDLPALGILTIAGLALGLIVVSRLRRKPEFGGF